MPVKRQLVTHWKFVETCIEGKLFKCTTVGYVRKKQPDPVIENS